MTPEPCETPYVVYDAQTIDRRYMALRTYLDQAYPRSRIFYALKACYLPPVIDRLTRFGCGLEIATPSEHAIARHFHLTGRQIFWNGPSILPDTLRGIAERGEFLSLDSPHLFEVFSRLASGFEMPVPVCLRISASAKERLGVSPEQAEVLLSSDSSLDVVGFHIHIGRGQEHGANMLDRKLDFLELIRRWETQLGRRPRYINLGGGIPLNEPLEDSLGPLVEALSRLKSAPELFIEPGAFLVEDSATAFASVISVKTLSTGSWASLDLGSNFLIPLSRAAFAVHKQAREEPGVATNFSGPFCYEADVIARDQPVAVEPGDVVQITRCGAYTESMSSSFFSSPPRVFWRNNSVLTEVRRTLDPLSIFLSHHGYPIPSV